MENFENKTQQLDYDVLKESLLSGKENLRDVRLKLLNADQSSATHEAARDNLIFLQDAEIQKYILEQSEAVQKGYYAFLGFTQWHIAQNCMFEDKESEGLELFKESVKNSIEGNADASWIVYGEGTIAYLENDIDRLRKTLTAENIFPKNKAILERMLARLEKGEKPDYKAVY